MTGVILMPFLLLWYNTDGDIMKKNEEFLQAMILLSALTVWAVVASPHPFFCMLLAGVLMLILTWRSLSEESERLIFVMQFLGSAMFAICAGGVAPFLILYECRMEKYPKGRFFLPTIGYFVYGLLGGMKSLPHTIYHMLLLLVAAGGIGLVEHLVLNYLSIKERISNSVMVTAVNEMYEKKLNRELTIKNYLADKNARLEERENISRNIHNSVGHSITAAIMTLDAAEMLFDTAPERAREKMNAANVRMRNGLSEIRHAVRVLDRENKCISISDLVQELETVVKSFVMDTTLEVRMDFREVGENLQIPHEHAEFLTGAVQELLSNGVRHGKATVFMLRLASDSGHILLKLSDNGQSDFGVENSEEKIQNGFGLKKLISYVKRCGGSAVFVNENGFQAELMLPLYEEEKHE